MIKDILTWLPSTVSVLVDAMFLLFRLTGSGAITTGDNRWHKLRLAWKHIYDIETKYEMDTVGNNQRAVFNHAPLARVASALLLDYDLIGQSGDNVVSINIEQAARKLGQLMNINRYKTDAGQKNGTLFKDEWAEIVRLLNNARTGWARCSSSAQPMTQLATDVDIDGLILQSFMEHAICLLQLRLMIMTHSASLEFTQNRHRYHIRKTW
jgi:hypothetical protein